MAADPVTPQAGLVSEVTVAGTAVIPVPDAPNGGFITNPANAPGSLFVDPVGSAATTVGGTTFELAPGQDWTIIPGQTTNTSVNSSFNNHVFCCVRY